MSIQMPDSAKRAGALAAHGKTESAIRIMVVDDQRLFCESIAGLLAAQPAFEVVATACNGAECIELACQLTPDIILMDVKMPQLDGIEATRRIKATIPQTRVILLTTFTSDGYVLDGLAAGASGYLLKDSSTAGLISAIKAVHAGEQVTAPNITSRMMQLLERQNAERKQENDGLTERELETLKLVARGMVAKEIARSLAISEKTVRNHISNIYHKLGIYDRSQIVIYAMKNGLVDIHEV
ncbi:response regulator transcription factor [Ktedonosporobacter rubrisoli]|uniref:Response regulator transcription factor n=1 Tax=Ktedonosporobacter rubrisoli TaxID=2509675 RepID=A0A4V0YZB2_KTERU|nr:response regulator transcription factor [Ktedonosporobacter rubrisoli]QBD79111.1 response regulator transcription factor [Ktedonosporobacter rubrisoli]